jgi:hypothetical protein
MLPPDTFPRSIEFHHSLRPFPSQRSAEYAARHQRSFRHAGAQVFANLGFDQRQVILIISRRWAPSRTIVLELEE